MIVGATGPQEIDRQTHRIPQRRSKGLQFPSTGQPRLPAPLFLSLLCSVPEHWSALRPAMMGHSPRHRGEPSPFGTCGRPAFGRKDTVMSGCQSRQPPPQGRPPWRVTDAFCCRGNSPSADATAEAAQSAGGWERRARMRIKPRMKALVIIVIAVGWYGSAAAQGFTLGGLGRDYSYPQ
jgi:hypothetical protein